MFLMKDGKIAPTQVKVSWSKSYTLAELEQLAHEYVSEMECGGKPDTNLRLMLSSLVAWLKRREKEGEG